MLQHFRPSSMLFKPSEYHLVIVSDVGLIFMAYLLYLFTRLYGYNQLAAHYIIPYLVRKLAISSFHCSLRLYSDQLANHWIIMLTYLQHTDPTIPHYRGKAWSFVRGALATVDRPFMGWIGRFFLHNVSLRYSVQPMTMEYFVGFA
jgi:fatty acid desaturase